MLHRCSNSLEDAQWHWDADAVHLPSKYRVHEQGQGRRPSFAVDFKSEVLKESEGSLQSSPVWSSLLWSAQTWGGGLTLFFCAFHAPITVQKQKQTKENLHISMNTEHLALC